MRTRVRSLAARSPVRGNIRTYPAAPDPRPFFQQASVVTLSSVREGLPNVILEAMAMGLPVVSTNVGGIPTVVEDGVTLFQGVTLGATGNEKTWKRHPTLEAGVFVGSGARILGPIVVGKDARVGAGSVVVKDVPAGSTVTGVPARVVRSDGVRVPSPAELAEARIETLEALVKDLQEEVWKLREKTALCRSSGLRSRKGVA